MKHSHLSRFSGNQEQKGPAQHHFWNKSGAGFTLVEMLVVAAIIAFLSVTLILNFSRTRIDIDQSANLVMATIREAQSKTVSSTIYNGYNPCGYGIHYDQDSGRLAIYVGPNAASPTNCATINKNYQAGEDTLISFVTLTDPKVEIKDPLSIKDIFFLPPDPKTYLDNDASLNLTTNPQITIQIGPIGEACPANCRTISIYPSGKIESQ